MHFNVLADKEFLQQNIIIEKRLTIVTQQAGMRTW